MADEREITIYDIAKHLNISATTVSRGLKDHPAINKHTRKKIAEAASFFRLSLQYICQQFAQQENPYNRGNSAKVKQLFHVVSLSGYGECSEPGKL